MDNPLTEGFGHVAGHGFDAGFDETLHPRGPHGRFTFSQALRANGGTFVKPVVKFAENGGNRWHAGIRKPFWDAVDLVTTQHPLPFGRGNVRKLTVAPLHPLHWEVGIHGRFWQDDFRMPTLDINPESTRYELMHELGHAADYALLGGKTLGTKMLGEPENVRRAWEISSGVVTALGGLMEAHGETAAARRIAKLPEKMREYLDTPPEVFARAYVQWIAERTGDPELSNTIQSVVGDDHTYPSYWQWDAEDWPKMRAAMDRVFAAAARAHSGDIAEGFGHVFGRGFRALYDPALHPRGKGGLFVETTNRIRNRKYPRPTVVAEMPVPAIRHFYPENADKWKDGPPPVFNHALDLIQRQHDLPYGNLTVGPIPKNVGNDVGGGVHARFGFEAETETPRIEFDYDADLSVVAHELGHAADATLSSHSYGTDMLVGFSPADDSDETVERALIDWWEAVQKTQGFKDIGFVPPRMQGYLAHPGEVWARAYVQWLAARSQDPNLLDYVHKVSSGKHETDGMHWAWKDKDFAPVLPLMDRVFEAALLRRGGHVAEGFGHVKGRGFDINWDPTEHPRGPLGQWVEKLQKASPQHTVKRTLNIPDLADVAKDPARAERLRPAWNRWVAHNAPKIDRVERAISAAHDLPSYYDPPMVLPLSTQAVEEAHHASSAISKTTELRLPQRAAETSQSPVLDVGHEMGHHMDFEILGGRAGYLTTYLDHYSPDYPEGSPRPKSWQPEMVTDFERYPPDQPTLDALKEWWNAARQTRELKELHVTPVLGRFNSDVRGYALNPAEVWARAYAQWIADEAADPEMLRELWMLESGGTDQHRATQWDYDSPEWKRMVKAMEEVMRVATRPDRPHPPAPVS